MPELQSGEGQPFAPAVGTVPEESTSAAVDLRVAGKWAGFPAQLFAPQLARLSLLGYGTGSELRKRPQGRSKGRNRSDPLGQPDGEAGAGLDGRGQQFIGGRFAGAVGERQVAMLQLLAPEFLDRGPEFALGFRQSRGLTGVMGVDHLLDSDGAGHGRAGSQKRRRGAKSEAGGMPERL